jgi:hypothetical protein
MTLQQKRAHDRLMNSLPVHTHFRKWPEKKPNVTQSYAVSRANGRKGRLAAAKVGGY